jgi:hypothetical protein
MLVRGVTVGDLQPQPALPRPVVDALVRLTRAAKAGACEWLTADEALQVVEAGEAVKAWAEAVSLDATAALAHRLFDLHDVEHDVRAGVGARSDQDWAELRVQANQTAASEIEAATGIGFGECQSRVAFAVAEEERTATVRSLMREGRLSGYRARLLFQEARHCPPEVADTIAARVLAPVAEGLPLSHARLRRGLRRELVLHESDFPRRERAEAVARRRVDAELRRDGTGWMQVSGEGERVVAARERIEAIARRLKAEGRSEARTHDAICSDIALDLLLYGWVPEDETYRALGKPPTARVNVIVSLTTLLGVTDGTGEIPGYGFVQAHHVREIATVAGSVWRRLVTDPANGRLLDLGTERYVPTPQMRDLVVHRDGVCRGPGCTVEARHCDLDHEVEWPRGQTRTTNLAAKHRRHHNLKTRRWWSSTMTPDGEVHWRTACGRSYLTTPHVYDDPAEQRLTSPDLGPPPY